MVTGMHLHIKDMVLVRGRVTEPQWGAYKTGMWLMD